MNHNSNTVLWLGCLVAKPIIKSTGYIHEKSLRIVNNDYESTYEELLSHNNCFSIHDQNIQRLAAEMYKVANDLSVEDIYPFS